MDLSKSGLYMFFREYQVEALKLLWSSGEGLGSRAVWNQVNDNIEGSISRASIINSLNGMVKLGVLNGLDETGKGGHRLRYSPSMNEKDLTIFLSEKVEQKLKEMQES